MHYLATNNVWFISGGLDINCNYGKTSLRYLTPDSFSKHTCIHGLFCGMDDQWCIGYIPCK